MQFTPPVTFRQKEATSWACGSTQPSPTMATGSSTAGVVAGAGSGSAGVIVGV